MLGCTVFSSSIFLTYALLIVVRCHPGWDTGRQTLQFASSATCKKADDGLQSGVVLGSLQSSCPPLSMQ